MAEDKVDDVLRNVDPARRSFLKQLVIGAGFALPIVASYSVKDLAYAGVGSPTTTTTGFTTTFTTST